MRFSFLDDAAKSRDANVSQAMSVNLYSEYAPGGNAKSQKALYGRPGLSKVGEFLSASRGCYVFNSLQYHVVGNRLYSFDGTTITDLTSAYSLPVLLTTSGNIQFADNGLAPAGGNQMAFVDSAGNGYVYNISPQPIITVNGDGVGAFADAVISSGHITSLALPPGEESGTGSGYFSATVSIIGGNPTTPASYTPVFGGSAVNKLVVVDQGSGYYSGATGMTVSISAPTVSGGVQATASILPSDIFNGKLISVTLTNGGTGYLSVPSVTINGGNPIHAAQVVAGLTGSAITGFSMNASGAGYGTPELQILQIAGPSYPTESASATIHLGDGYVGAFQVASAGYVGYAGNPSVVCSGGAGIGALGTAFVDVPTTPASATCTVDGTSAVTAVTLVPGQGGAGYKTSPIVTIYDALGNGSGATAKAILSGIVTSVELVVPGLYWFYGMPTIELVGGGYTRQAKCHLVSGPGNNDGNAPIQKIVMDDNGAGYTSAPQVVFKNGKTRPIGIDGHSGNVFDTTQADPNSTNGWQAKATANFSAGIVGFTVTAGGANYSQSTNVLILSPITSIGVANGGTDYTSAPTVVIGEVLSRLQITNQGSGYSPTSPPTLNFAGTFDVQPVTQVVVDGTGKVSNIIILSPGLNHTGSNSVTFSSGSATCSATFSKATATATVNQDISYITVVNGGKHYSDIPVVTITDITGYDAIVSAQIKNGLVYRIDITSPGQKYTNPSVTFTGGGGLSNGNGILASINCINRFGIIGYGSGSTIFQTSEVNDFCTWSALSFAAKSTKNDPLVSVGIDAIGGYLPLIGQKTFELWAPATGNTPPFVYSTTINVGLAAWKSLVDMDNTLYWLANNNHGEFLGIVRFTGNGAEIISTTDINYEIQQMTTITDAIAYTYTDSGHTFYVITFPTGLKTYAYDIGTKEWHRRSFDTGNPYTQTRELGNWYCYYNNRHYITDSTNGNIYIFSDTVYTDNGHQIARLRFSPPVYDADGIKQIQHDLLEIDMKTKVGTALPIATAVCTIASGIVQNSVTVTASGSGYIVAPDVLFLGGGGFGATGYSVINGAGNVIAVYVTNGGSGYLTAPTIQLRGGVNNPMAILSFSDDNGDTWTDDMFMPIGESINASLNQTWGSKLRVVWSMLGYARSRTYRLLIKDPVNIALIQGYIEGVKLDV